MKIVLFYPKTKELKEVDDNKVIDDMYYKLAILPTSKQINKSEKYINEMREYISKHTNKMPLFDYDSKNIYLVNSDDVYMKVSKYNFRFPDSKIILLLQKTIEGLNKIKNIEWIYDYIEKLNKNLNFLNNFDIKILKETFIDLFLNTNPTTKELTTCIKPSYLPNQTYQSPYYTKSELVNLGLNLGIINEEKFPWKYSKQEISDICKEISKYEINTQMLIYNQLFMLYNNAKSYVQFYSLFGSYYFNNYLRNKNSTYDKDLNGHIDNFLKIIHKTPPLDQSYEVYRFIENDEYISQLKIGDIFEEKSFISTTRNPFYSFEDNKFGFILIKIKLKKNVPGIALLMESYSNYPHEQEVLLPPSKLKLIDINSDFKYYHTNKLAEKKIKKKYVFEYVVPLSNDIDFYTKDYNKNKPQIPLIDFRKEKYIGDTTIEKTFSFFNSLPKINLRREFKSKIGDIEYTFYAYFLTQNKVYSKFFFLQKEDETINKILGDEIYLTIQNPNNGEIELLVEIRTIISVNYYHRYSGLTTTIPDNLLVTWLSDLSSSLGISTVIIHGNYSSYAHIIENLIDNKKIKEQNLLDNFKTIQNIDNPDVNILNLYTADTNTYCTDLIEYMFNGTRRYNGLTGISFSYIERKVPLHLLDKLKTIKFAEMYNNYKTKLTGYEYLNNVAIKMGDIDLFSLYKNLHINYPYLIPKLQELILLIYPKNIILPWHFYYVLKPYEYLFENKLIDYMPITAADKIDELTKNLEEEVKFIHENKFRQIFVPND